MDKIKNIVVDLWENHPKKKIFIYGIILGLVIGQSF